MQCNTVDDCCHGELAHAGLQECPFKVAFSEWLGLLKESVGLVAVGEIGARHNHVAHALSKGTEHVGARSSCCKAWLVLNGGIVDGINFALDIIVELGCFLGIIFAPGFFFCLALGDDCTQLLCTFAV